MGVYSTNRISSVAESTVTTPIEEEFEYMPNDNLGNIMEAVIGLRENEHNMFNSLIELDFVSVTNEATMLEGESEAANSAQNQSKLKAIMDKIMQLFDQAIETIKTAASNFIAKIKEMRDNKIVDAYKDIKVEDLKGFKGISNFAFPKGEIPDSNLIKNSTNDMQEILNNIKNGSDKESIDHEFETVGSKVKEIASSIKRDDFFEEKVESFIPTQDQIETMISEVGDARNTIAMVKTDTEKIATAIKLIKSKAKSSIHDSKDEIEVYKAKTVYKASSELVRAYMKLFSEYTHCFTAQIAAYRKALIICGRYATKHGSSNTNDESENSDAVVETESALLYSLAESSDEFVYAHFAY